MIEGEIMNKPNLFIVGFPKTGTTALAEMLNNHPEISYGKRKEAYYFDTLYFENKDLYPFPKADKLFKSHNILSRNKPVFNNEEEYCSLYNNVDDIKYYLDATVFYIAYSEIANLIYEFNESSKIIIMIRNPIDRAWSNYVYLKGIYEDDFSEAIANEKNKINQGYHPFSYFLNLGLYYERIKKYIKVFGKSNVKVFLDEDLKSNTQDTLEQIFSWLELSKNFNLDLNKKYNSSVNTNSKVNWIRTNNIFLKIKPLVKKLISKKNINRAKKIFKDTEEMKDSDLLKLKKIYKEDIIKTSKLINRDLSHWT
jgi:hypothetical protein